MKRLVDQYWTRTHEGRTRLGLAPDFAESIEGDWVALDLPSPGALIRAGETFGFLTTDSATHDLRAPMTFRVASANEALASDAALARLSPTAQGWLLEIEPVESVAAV